MRSFTCNRCGQLVFFENTRCLRCEASLGLDPDALGIIEVTDESRRCANADLIGCGWLVDRPGELCRSCVLTRTRPDDDDVEAMDAWADVEADKRRLVFQLMELGLPVQRLDIGSGTGFAFDLLSSRRGPVTTGHLNGVITLDLAESDPVHREQMRAEMGEAYRTVLGHLRHEIGHAYWPVLLGDDASLAEARRLFGDDTADYQEALDRHYAEGAPSDWEDTYVSAYATMHPYEDWAETFAHYLHIRATLQTAAAYRLRTDGPPEADEHDAFSSDPESAPMETIDDIVDAWLPLSYALNAVNRSMGGDDLYPFVLPPAAIDKLGFVHRRLRDVAEARSGRAA